jgi:hypothetical protein
MWVTFSEDKTKMCFHYFYKTIQVESFEIEGYFRTVHKTRISNFKGLLIKLKNEKVIEVTEYNLKSLDSINIFLKNGNAHQRGDRNSWFPFKRKV